MLGYKRTLNEKEGPFETWRRTVEDDSHLWPDSEDQTREAVDAVLNISRPNHGPRSVLNRRLGDLPSDLRLYCSRVGVDSQRFPTSRGPSAAHDGRRVRANFDEHRASLCSIRASLRGPAAARALVRLSGRDALGRRLCHADDAHVLAGGDEVDWLRGCEVGIRASDPEPRRLASNRCLEKIDHDFDIEESFLGVATDITFPRAPLRHHAARGVRRTCDVLSVENAVVKDLLEDRYDEWIHARRRRADGPSEWRRMFASIRSRTDVRPKLGSLHVASTGTMTNPPSTASRRYTAIRSHAQLDEVTRRAVEIDEKQAHDRAACHSARRALPPSGVGVRRESPTVDRRFDVRTSTLR